MRSPTADCRVDFYQLAEDAPLARERYACRLAEKAVRNGYSLLVLAADDAHAAQLDDLLWSFSAESFLPHGRAGSDHVCVGTAIDPEAKHTMLLNLGAGMPDGCARFTRIAEIVPASPSARDAARAVYRRYQQQGFSVHYHQLTGHQPPGHDQGKPGPKNP